MNTDFSRSISFGLLYCLDYFLLFFLIKKVFYFCHNLDLKFYRWRYASTFRTLKVALLFKAKHACCKTGWETTYLGVKRLYATVEPISLYIDSILCSL